MASQVDPIAPLTLVAIDIAKGVNVALVEHSDGRQQRSGSRTSVRTTIDLWASCEPILAPCRIAIEPTADYHRTLAYRLVCEGFEVVLVSSVAGARLREAVFNSWDKSDPKDAQVITRLLKQGMTQRYCDPLVTKIHDLQELSKTYQHISRVRTRLQHLLLTHYLTLVFSGDRTVLDRSTDQVRIPAMTDTRTGDGGQRRSEATQVGRLCSRLSGLLQG